MSRLDSFDDSRRNGWLEEERVAPFYSRKVGRGRYSHSAKESEVEDIYGDIYVCILSAIRRSGFSAFLGVLRRASATVDLLCL